MKVAFEYAPLEENILNLEWDSINSEKYVLNVKVSRETLGSQPFLAVETFDENFHHVNCDFQTPFREWSYTFDEHTFPIETIKNVGVGTNDQQGFYHTSMIQVSK